MLEGKMVPDHTSVTCRRGAHIVIDDRSRLPARFCGRFTTSATSRLYARFDAPLTLSPDAPPGSIR
jgi:hypothetical protein